MNKRTSVGAIAPRARPSYANSGYGRKIIELRDDAAEHDCDWYCGVRESNSEYDWTQRPGYRWLP